MTDAQAAMNILIVDDDVDIRSTLADFLQDEGFRVDAVSNGRDALVWLREHPSTSLVLLDLMMPIMDGFTFRAQQKKDPAIASVPVVVMTARGAIEPGILDVVDVIPKPMDLNKLVQAIHRNGRTAA